MYPVQLVTYAHDLTMRIWNIDARLKDLCYVDHHDDDDDDDSREEQLGRVTAELEMEVAMQSQVRQPFSKA